MIVTDSIDSLLVSRVIANGRAGALRARRAWILVVTLVALAVAGEELIEFCGYRAPLDELTLSAITVVLLLLTAAAVGFANRRAAMQSSAS